MDLADHGTPALAHLGAVGLEIDGEVFAPELKIWLIVEEDFTECDEVGDVEDRVWGQVVELKAIKMEKTSEERMDGKLRPRRRWETKITHSLMRG